MFCLFTSGSSWPHVLWHDCPFLAFTSHGKGCFQSISRGCPVFYKWNECSLLWTITRDSPRMPSPREEGSLTRERMKPSWEEWRGMNGKVPTVPTGYVGWEVSLPLPQHPSAGGQLCGTASSLLLFSLVYSANTELRAEMGAKADCFLPWFPFS